MKKRIGNIFMIILMIISISALIYSSINIYKWHLDNKNIKKLNGEIEEVLDIQESDDNSEIIEPEKVQINDPYLDYIKVNLLDVNLDELKNINKDTVGFIEVKGTNINYPFVQTKNNDYYLTHDYHKNYNEAGWIFLDYRNNLTNLDKNTIIYGHGRLNKAMFGSLKNVLSKEWYNNIDNHIIRISMDNKNTLWQIFSVYHLKTTNDYIKVDFKDNKDYLDFINLIKERSIYNFNTSVSEFDKILTLSTCYNSSEKLVVHAKLIKYQDKED